MVVGTDWAAPPSSVSLSGGDVHLWRAGLDCGEAIFARLAQLLSEDERQRASRFHFELDRRRFVVGRGILRDILSRYIGSPAVELAFRYGAHGKPALTRQTHFSFNVAHSQAVALFAVTLSARIGIDVEFVRPDIDVVAIANHHFSPWENALLQSVARTHRCRAFFDCWTRKEAYIKALGGGFSVPLSRFDVTMAPGEPARLVVDREDPLKSLQWTLRDLPVQFGYVAATAIKARVANWFLFDWLAD